MVDSETNREDERSSYAGLATHYLHSSTLPELEVRLSELRFRDYDTLEQRLRLIDQTIEEYNTGLPYDKPMRLSGARRAAIDRIFSGATPLRIQSALLVESSKQQAAAPGDSNGSSNGNGNSSSGSSSNNEVAAWARETLETLQRRSPVSLWVATAQMEFGLRWSIAETFQREHVLAGRMIAHPDFETGVTAVLIDRKKTYEAPSSASSAATPQPPTPPKAKTAANAPPLPRWQPIDSEDEGRLLLNRLFNVAGGTRLPLLTAGDYKEYPFAHFLGLPSEARVHQVIKSPPPGFLGGLVGMDASKGIVEPPPPEANFLSSSSSSSPSSLFSAGALDSPALAPPAPPPAPLAAAAAARLPGDAPDAPIVTRQRVLNYFLRLYGHKVGVREKVTEILRRKTLLRPLSADGSELHRQQQMLRVDEGDDFSGDLDGANTDHHDGGEPGQVEPSSSSSSTRLAPESMGTTTTTATTTTTRRKKGRVVYECVWDYSR